MFESDGLSRREDEGGPWLKLATPNSMSPPLPQLLFTRSIIPFKEKFKSFFNKTM